MSPCFELIFFLSDLECKLNICRTDDIVYSVQIGLFVIFQA